MEEVILDIDFDFFTKPVYYGSNQKLRELDKIREHQKTSEIWLSEFGGFLSKFPFNPETKSQVSLDHKDFLKLGFNNEDKKYIIIHFDAHHDIYIDEGNTATDDLYDSDSSYLLHLIKNKMVSKIIWVYPPFCDINTKNSRVQEEALKKAFNFRRIDENRYFLDEVELFLVNYENFDVLDYLKKNDYKINFVFLCYSPFFSKNDTVKFKELTELIKGKSKSFEII